MSINIKLATWNVGSLLCDLDKNTDTLIQALSLDSPDVFCAQELPFSSELWDKIKQNCGFEYFYYYKTSRSHVAEGWDMGVGIFSKYPFGKVYVRELTLPTERIFYNGREETWHRKYYLSTRLFVDDGELTLFTGHGFPFYRYGLLEEEHSLVYGEIDSFVSEYSSGERFVICTDFNAYNAVRFMPCVSRTHRDVFADVPTRPTGRKTDAIVVPISSEVSSSINRVLEGMDHNYLSVTLSV